MENIVETGFYDLDYVMKGFRSSEIILVAGRPSMGKTLLALNIARNVAIAQNVKTVFFSLELSRQQILERVKNEVWEGEIDFLVDDTPTLSVEDIFVKCRIYKNEIGLIIIDYLQLVSDEKCDKVGVACSKSINLIMCNVMKKLKDLAKELSVPVIVISQYPKSIELRENKRPILEDLKKFGTIEQYADTILLLYRDECYNGEETEKKGIIEINIAKQSRGETCCVEIRLNSI